MHYTNKQRMTGEEHKASHNVEQSLEKHLDEIATALAVCDTWNRKMANACRAQHFRGWGRWHDKMSKCYHKWLLKLSKISADNIEYIPEVDHSVVAKAEQVDLKTMAEFKHHHEAWNKVAGEAAKVVTETMMEAHEINIGLYHCLMELLEEIQDEMKHVKRIVKNLDNTGWENSYVMEASEKLHEYYEKGEEKGLSKEDRKKMKDYDMKADLGLEPKGKHGWNLG